MPEMTPHDPYTDPEEEPTIGVSATMLLWMSLACAAVLEFIALIAHSRMGDFHITAGAYVVFWTLHLPGSFVMYVATSALGMEEAYPLVPTALVNVALWTGLIWMLLYHFHRSSWRADA